MCNADVSFWSFNSLDTAGLLFSLSDNNGIDLLGGERQAKIRSLKKEKAQTQLFGGRNTEMLKSFQNFPVPICPALLPQTRPPPFKTAVGNPRPQPPLATHSPPLPG